MKGKVCITGATSGLGLAYAREYAQRGYDLIVTGRRKDKLEKHMKALAKETNVHITSIIVELSNEEGLKQLLACIKDEEIEILINNAGFGLKPVFAEVPEEDLDRILFLQTTLVTRLTHYVLKRMLVRNNGTIINVASDGAFAIMPHNVLYGSSKSYIVALTQGIYTETYDTGVKVQVICPGFMDTDFHESAGMNPNKKRKGLMKFSDPVDIVAASMRDLKKGRVVCRPTFDVKIIDWCSRFLPKKLLYKMEINFARKVMSKKGRK